MTTIDRDVIIIGAGASGLTAATELKKACGTGGTIAENTVEIQGDHRNRIRQLLMSKGWTVKG